MIVASKRGLNIEPLSYSVFVLKDMLIPVVWMLLTTVTLVPLCFSQQSQISEVEMEKVLAAFNLESIAWCNRVNLASWDVATDVGNKEKENAKVAEVLKYSEFQKNYYNKNWKDAIIDDYKDETIKRQLFFLKKLNNAALEENDLKNLTNTIIRMSSIYNSATICPYDEPNCSESSNNRLTLDPHITERLAKSRNFEELKYLWTKWHDATGRLMRSDYLEYVELMNKMAIGNGYTDAAEYWLSDYEVSKFDEEIDSLWDQVKPLYEKLHTYMRYKLMAIYGDKIDRNDPLIPAHLLGNMWAQSWHNLFDDTKPFKDGATFDVTEKMLSLKYDAMKMFQTSDEFYMSLGLPTNVMSYTGHSIINKPENRTIQCHASAWDFCDGKDFRIKMCTNINQEDLITVHHEMGHIQYYIQYKDLPLVLRKGANPGFHEAVGDTMALSVANPRHLLKIGLLDDYKDSEAENINALYLEALQRVAFLPFGFLLDKWRWNVFSGKVQQDEWNSHFWDLRKQYQKVSPPTYRSNEEDFDPGAKFHVPANSKYLSYFVSHILEFSFYKALCIEAGEYGEKKPNASLHTCDFYKSKEAGKKLADGLKLGGSKKWQVALEAITGSPDLTSDAILEYFKPLSDFLAIENEKLAQEDEIRQKLADFDKEATKMCQKVQSADWEKTTDLNNQSKQDIYNQAIAENAKFMKEETKQFRDLNPNDFPDYRIRRQIHLVSNLKSEALDEPKLIELTNTISTMIGIYNRAEFCKYSEPNCSKPMTLDPEITEVMGTSQNYNELEYTWSMWYNKTGTPMKEHFKKYIDLSNEAARLNKFNDTGDMWRSRYEDPNLIENLKMIWKQVEPLYNELHTYTRTKLINIYGDKIDPNDKLIPAHLLGNMWAQSWVNLYDRIKPFKNGSDIDITASLRRSNFTEVKIFEESDRFYQSLGLESNNMSYTGKSIIKKPNDRLIVCHASAWDMCDGKDFRIKQCTEVNQQNFITAHHEMGHIQYYILYKDQPMLFREGANPGFHEAVGDLVALSVSNPTHLKKVGLLTDYKDSSEDNINSLFKMALERVAFLPFGLLMDLYRFDLFSGKIAYNDWNEHWERLREEYQKVRSPVKRDKSHFDAGGKNHVSADYSYTAYFVAHILEFQLLKSLCMAAGQYEPNNHMKPLHKCDLEGSKIAGNRLRDGLSLGLSKHWSESLSIITNGERELSADAILEYFKPLHEFLIEFNKNTSNLNSARPDKVWYLIGGFSLLVLLVTAIAAVIYYINRK